MKRNQNDSTSAASLRDEIARHPSTIHGLELDVGYRSQDLCIFIVLVLTGDQALKPPNSAGESQSHDKSPWKRRVQPATY